MAGHAPEVRPDRQRLFHWLGEASDIHLSLLMLAMALGVATLLYLFNQRFLA